MESSFLTTRLGEAILGDASLKDLAEFLVSSLFKWRHLVELLAGLQGLVAPRVATASAWLTVLGSSMKTGETCTSAAQTVWRRPGSSRSSRSSVCSTTSLRSALAEEASKGEGPMVTVKGASQEENFRRFGECSWLEDSEKRRVGSGLRVSLARSVMMLFDFFVPTNGAMTSSWH